MEIIIIIVITIIIILIIIFIIIVSIFIIISRIVSARSELEAPRHGLGVARGRPACRVPALRRRPTG